MRLSTLHHLTDSAAADARYRSGVRELHAGFQPESAIAEDSTRWLELVHGTAAVPPTITAILDHLVFELIHPFYDGNGRTGRRVLGL